MVSISGRCSVSTPIHLDALDSQLSLVGSDSGASITGGIEISGWTQQREAACEGCGFVWKVIGDRQHHYDNVRTDPRMAVLQAALPPGTSDSRQFYVNGARANRTRMLFPQETASIDPTGYVSHLATTYWPPLGSCFVLSSHGQQGTKTR